MGVVMEHVVHVYGRGAQAVVALNGLDLEVQAGEVCIVRGPNGSGKTTLIGVLTGELAPTAGRLRLAQAGEASPRVAVVRQFDNLLDHLTVREHLGLMGDADAAEAIPAHLRDRRAGELTRGERQQAAVVVAMSTHPDLLLADEPTAALSPDEAHAVYQRIADEARRRGTTVLLVTHDARAEAIADRVVALRDGRIGEAWRPGAPAHQVVDARGWVRLPDEVRAGLDSWVEAQRQPEGVLLAGRFQASTRPPLPAPPRRLGDAVVLHIDGLVATHGDRTVFRDLEWQVPQGALGVVTGTPGSGKSTLLRVLAGLQAPTAGSLHWEPAAAPPALFTADLPFAGHCTLRELLGGHPAIEQLALGELAGRRLHTLSGGQRQRALIALALAHPSPLLLLDDPTTALDDANARLVVDAVAGCGKTLVIATHDERVLSLATHALRLP